VTDDLLPGNDPFFVRRQIAFDNMGVRAAYATDFDRNQKLAFSRFGDRQIN
jgi:hypothetical protein